MAKEGKAYKPYKAKLRVPKRKATPNSKRLSMMKNRLKKDPYKKG